MLPGPKVTEIAETRGVPVGQTVVVLPPARHRVQHTTGAHALHRDAAQPVGGQAGRAVVHLLTEFLSICKAMLQTGITPDFIIVDGAEEQEPALRRSRRTTSVCR